MTDIPPAVEERIAHWRRVWGEKAPEEATWHQPTPEVSLALIEAAAVTPWRPVIDVGGGAATLVDHLLARGFKDLTVLDIAPEALAAARARLGEEGDRVTWIAADITRWTPPESYVLWHDRAVFHFLTEPEDQRAYGRVLETALAPDGQAIIATFAPEGPEKCSGLPVQRHDPDSLVTALGGGFTVLEQRREEHATPAGNSQTFLWCRLGRS